MTTVARGEVGVSALPIPARATPWRASAGLAWRDFIVMAKQWPNGNDHRPRPDPARRHRPDCPRHVLRAVCCPWESLSRVPWLKYADLVNPLVYMNESLRAALTSGVPHMPLRASLTAMTGFTAVLAVAGITGPGRQSVA